MVAKELTTTPCRCDEAANLTKMGQNTHATHSSGLHEALSTDEQHQPTHGRLRLPYRLPGCLPRRQKGTPRGARLSFQHCHSSSHIVSSSSGVSIDEEFIRLRSVISPKKEGGTLFARRLGSTRCLWLALSRACVTSGRRKIGAMSTTCWRLESPPKPAHEIRGLSTSTGTTTTSWPSAHHNAKEAAIIF